MIVVAVLAAFAIFIWVTIDSVNTSLLAFSGYPSFNKIIASVALTFFAYLGFNVITFTGGDLKNPRRDIPRATYLSIGIAATTYVLIAIGVFGTLTVAEVIKYGETAIAEAARPSLGDTGFKVMAVVALLSTAGCTNATLYACNNLTNMLTDEGLFPEFLGSRSRLGKNAGLLITTALVIVIANVVNLSAIASVGSAVSLMIFVLIGVAGYRRRVETGSNAVLVLFTIALTVLVLAFFAVDTARTAPETFTAIIAITVLSVILDAIFRHPRPDAGELQGPSEEGVQVAPQGG
jgi:amino acid transporter